MNQYDVAAYVYPAYTGADPRTRIFWDEGIGEWQSVKNAISKFDGHSWPRKPLWGYVNEADPYVMEMQIRAALDHGVTVFIYDWYWYDNRPFMENCLNDGFLKAKNNQQMKFFLMWANHNVNYMFDIRNAGKVDADIWKGGVNRESFEQIARRLMQKYFCLPNYYCIDGKPVFMLYDIITLIDGLGGIKETQDAFIWFDHLAKENGFGGIHFMLNIWQEGTLDLSGIAGIRGKSPKEILNAIGFDSVTHYQFINFTDVNRDYTQIIQDVVEEWERVEKEFQVTYFPHISLGWDNNPRFQEFRPEIVKNNTPENIQKALQYAKEYVDHHPSQPPLITINSWNEWTESSYLQPDDRYGYGYLEAVKSVFTK